MAITDRPHGGDRCCANCGAVVQANRGPHCPACGAQVAPERLAFRSIFANSIEHFLSLDLPLLRTFIDLFRFPGRVASDYVAGKRKSYSNPLKYNLIAATVIVAVIHLVVGDEQIGAEQVAGLPDTPVGRFIGDAQLLAQEWHYKYLQIVYLLSLPVLAWMLRLLLGRRSQRNVIEFYAMCLLVFGHVYLIQAACILVGHWFKGTGIDVAFAVVSGASPFIYVPWATAQFSRGGALRAVLMSLLAFLIFAIFISLALLMLAVGWLLVERLI